MARIFVLFSSLWLSGCTSLTTLFFYPQTVWIATPADAGLVYQDVWLRAVDGTQLHSWWIPAQGAQKDSQVMVLYLHGNGENISSHSHSMYWLSLQGVSVLALDYRGYGASQGKALLPEVLQDVEAAARWLRVTYPNKRLVVLGQSLGTVLAVNFVAQAGAEYQVQALVLDAAIARFDETARSVLSKNFLGWLVWPWTVFLPNRWDPIDQVDDLTVPVLFLHSPEDKVVPYLQGQRLYQRMKNHHKAVCWQESQGPHIGSFAYPSIRSVALDFIIGLQCNEEYLP